MIENKIFFIKSLDEFSSRYLKTDPKQRIDQIQAINEIRYLKSKISEFFLLYDKISFKVFGENVPLILLINWFGADGVLELLEQNALEFVLWTPLITYLDPKNDIPGIHPLQSGVQTSDVHCKPRISAQKGFNWMRGEVKPSKSVQKRIIRQVKKNTIVPPQDVSHDVLNQLKFYREEYKPKNRRLSLSERKQFASIAEESIELSVASKQGYSFWNEENKMRLLDKKFDYYFKANIIHKKASKVFEVENLPDIAKLVDNNKIPTRDIPKLRNNNDSIKFREWIHSKSLDTSYKSVSKEYVESLRPRYGFTGSKWFKPVRLVTFVAVGGLIGSFIDGQVATYGTISGIASEILSSFIDQYILEGIVSGWKPQNFIEQNIRPYTKNTR